MPKNITFSLGNIALIDKIDSETDFSESVFGNIGGRSRSFIPAVKLLISNKLNQSVSINKILDFTPAEQLEIFGFEETISNRSLYRVLERLGDNQPVVLEAYKNRDLAEKFIRDLKEGAEMRLVRHWSKHAVISFVLVVLVTKVLVSLTQFFCKNPIVKNLKVLKKYLTNLTLTIVYPSFGYGIKIISNFSPELQPVLGDFIQKFGSLNPPDFW